MRTKNTQLRWFMTLFMVLLTGCSLSFNDNGNPEVAAITGAPSVELAAPLPNATFLKGVTVNILASIANAGQDIQRVEFKVDQNIIADVNAPNPSGAARFSVTRTWTPDAAGQYTISVTAYRANGSASNPSTVQISVIEDLPTEAPTNTLLPPPTTPAPQFTATATFTLTAVVNHTATNVPPTPTETSSQVIVKVNPSGMFVRRGPSTNFEPRLGVLEGDKEVPVLGSNLDGTWFKITFNGQEAWISSSPNLVTVIAGDVSSLTKEAGPPIPTLAPPTATQPPLSTSAPTNAPGVTNTATSGANLRITGFALVPAQPGSNQPAKAQINIFNDGAAATSGGGRVTLAIADRDGAGNPVFGQADIPVIGPQANYLIEINFTDTAATGTIRRAVAIVDSDNVIPETNDQDNTSSIDYTVQ